MMTGGTRRGITMAIVGWALAGLGGKCNSEPASDGGAATGDAAPSGDGGSVAQTCPGVCACLASACPDFPFAPDCVIACQDTTHAPWDLACRANECSAARTNHDAHCANAAGVTKCQ